MSAPGASSSIASIVGTSTVWVIRSRSIVSSTAAASKRGSSDLLRADPRAREQVRDPGDVEHRAHVQPALVGAVAGGGEVVLRVGEQVAVAEHHALRRARSCRRCRRWRRACRGRGRAARRGGPASEVLPRRQRHRAQPRSTCSSSVIRTRSSRVLDDEPQLLGREPVVQAHDHAARRRHAQPRLGVRARVGAEEADPRARGEIERDEAVRQLAVA